MNNIISKLTNLSKTKKAVLWFVFIDIFQKGISLLTVPIFTRLLNPEQFGIFSVFQAWLTIITIICSLYLWAGVFNNGMVKFEEDKDNFIASLQMLITVITITIFIFYIIFKQLFNELLGLSTFLMILIFIQILFNAGLNLWYARQRFEYKYKALLYLTISMSLLNPIFGVIFIYTSEEKGIARIISVVIIQVIFGIILYVYNFIRGKKYFVFKYWKYALVINLPLIPHYLSQVILNQADTIMIKKFIGLFEAGVYSIAYSVGTILLIIISSLNTSLVPWIYRNLKDKNYKDIEKKTNFTILIVAILVLCFISFVPEAISIFASSEYANAVWIVPPIALSVFFIFLYGLFTNITIYFEKNKFIMWISIFISILNVFLNLITLPYLGYLVAAYSTLFCYILLTVIHYIYMLKICRTNGISYRIYNSMLITITCILLIFITAFLVFLYNYTLIRYLIILLGLLIMILNKNRLLKNGLEILKK